MIYEKVKNWFIAAGAVIIAICAFIFGRNTNRSGIHPDNDNIDDLTAGIKTAGKSNTDITEGVEELSGSIEDHNNRVENGLGRAENHNRTACNSIEDAKTILRNAKKRRDEEDNL